MASLITTMFVPNPPSLRSPLHKRPPSLLQATAISPPRPLAPVSTLEHSISCIHLGQNIPSASTVAVVASAPSTPLKNVVIAAARRNGLPTSCAACEGDDGDVFTDVPLHSDPSCESSPNGIRAVVLALRHAALHAHDSPTEIAQYHTALPHCHYSPTYSLSPELPADPFLRSNSRARGPFKPQRANRGTSAWQLKQFADATLGSGSLKKAVKLPEGEDINEWLAVNVVDFYNQINLLYGAVTEFCSPQTCPEMKATDEFEYLWQDNENFKKPTKMPAPEYIEHLMAWCQNNIDNEQMFPSRIGVPFPKTFPSLVRQMFKRLYRVYAHIYCHHFPVIIQLGLDPHLNTSFKHYVLFVHEHNLATGKDFWGPLGDLVEKMLEMDE